MLCLTKNSNVLGFAQFTPVATRVHLRTDASTKAMAHALKMEMVCSLAHRAEYRSLTVFIKSSALSSSSVAFHSESQM